MSLKYRIFFLCNIVLICSSLNAQSISDFVSLSPGQQTPALEMPYTHTFQVLISHGDSLMAGGYLADDCDFTGYVPIGGSSRNGYLSVSSESLVAGASILSISWDSLAYNGWRTTYSQSVDFSVVGGGSRHCSGTVTPWNTVIVCEEIVQGDLNGDGYYDYGWATEIDPATAKVRDFPGGLPFGDKLWALGNMAHENVGIHPNRRTAYEGADMTVGYLFKFVADSANMLNKGRLYVYKGSKNGTGEWILIPNNTPEECNRTLFYADSVGGTVFSGVEDVEYNPLDNYVYLAVKNEDCVYRFRDSDPLTGLVVPDFHIYVGRQSYFVKTETDSIEVPWGTGNDNLAFDDKGNLWVLQDGSLNYIWVVDSGHTQANPKVRIFGKTPAGAEPTGITFSPDYRFLFMSVMHPSESNSDKFQPDAWGNPVSFGKDRAFVIARREFLGKIGLPIIFGRVSVTNLNKKNIVKWRTEKEVDITNFVVEHSTDKAQWDSVGVVPAAGNSNQEQQYEFYDGFPKGGKNFYRLKIKLNNGTHIQHDLGAAYYLVSPHQVWGFPNPAKDEITIMYSHAFSVKEVQWFAADGRLLPLQYQIFQDKIVASLPSTMYGIHFIRLTLSNGEVLTLKYETGN